MKRDDFIYTAALVDGEGSVLLQRRHSGEFRSPAVTVPSTTRVFMRFLKSEFGGTVSSKNPYTDRASASWSWSIRGDAALKFLKHIVRFMKEPEKVRRAKLLLQFYKKVTPRNGKYTKQALRLKRDFERKFFSRSKKVKHV